ncbi:MAG: stage II sporulation protein P [Clostridia bacterium]|nr:stage II sporulation protein P [Clostridia bacterium]
MKALRGLMIILFLCLFLNTAQAEELSLFSDAAPDETAFEPITPASTAVITPAPPEGFTLEVISSPSGQHAQGSFRVLIYHTHTYEAYTATDAMPYTPTEKWRTANETRNMVAVGGYLAELLESAGVEVVHDTTAFEPPVLSSAYERSLDMLKARQESGERYNLYIDLHRDAYSKNNGPNTVEKDGVQMARLLMLIGKGTGQTGAGYAEKPDWESNRQIAQALSNRLNLQCDGLCRGVSLKSGRYNQHVAPCCVLIEVGNNYNTLEEALAAMPCLANAICALADGQIE